MTVPNGEPAENLVARVVSFATLLEASSLGAPHVAAASEHIPCAARHRMVQAAWRRPDNDSDASREDSPHNPDGDGAPAPAAPCPEGASEAAHTSSAAADAASAAHATHLGGHVSAGRSAFLEALRASHAFGQERRDDREPPDRYVMPRRSFCLVSAHDSAAEATADAGVPRRPESEGAVMSDIWVRSPREWQQAAYEDYTSRLPETYLAAVCPGGGKTEYALAVAKYLIQQGRINFVIVVSPTEALTRQWADKAAQFGIDLNPDMQGNEPLKQSREFVGGSVTYGLLAAKKETAFAFSTAMQIRRTLVILDEAHHTGEDKAWGIAVQTAFELARHRLLLTGTPTRSDTDRIPFARYRQDPDGVRRIVRDYDYGTGRGVRDQVIRGLDFRFYDAKVNELPFGETVSMSANISEAVSRGDHSKFMGVVMDPESGWFSDLLPSVHKELMAIRRTVPNAGCLILANDKEHVHAYERLVKEITGYTPAVVISEKSDARETLEEFTDSDEPYIIAIRMVSEGVDIPRLRVLVWLTRTKTELFFAQGTARVVRIPNRADSGPAVVFMPSLDPLRELAQGIDKDIVHEITELEQQVAAYESEQLTLSAQGPDAGTTLPAQSGGGGGGTDPAAEGAGQLGFSSFSVEDVELERTMLGSEPHAVEHHHYAQHIIDEDGMAQTDVAVVRRLIARGRIQTPGLTHEIPQQTQAATEMQTAAFRIRKEYQDKLNTICAYIARRHYKGDYKMVRGRINRETGASADFGTIDQTKKAIASATAWAKSLDAGGPR